MNPSSTLEVVQPDGWVEARGFSYATITEAGSLLHVAAVAGQSPDTFHFDPSLDLIGQWRQALSNLAGVLAAGKSSLQQIAMLRVYVTNMEDYRRNAREIGALHREFFGEYSPSISLMQVVAFAVDAAQVEMDAVAYVPSAGSLDEDT
jgi:enamine deaminase RidA (YjgF/YER057c/UK114 family)